MMKFHHLTTQHAAGIDLHKNNLRICIMNLTGKILYQSTITRHKQKNLKKCLAPYGSDVTIGVESTYNWYWLLDWCREQGLPSVLGHAAYIKKKMVGKNKNDKIDAHGIAGLLRLNDFPYASTCPVEYRATRDLVRRRNAYVNMRTKLLLHTGCLDDQYLLDERHELLLNGPDKELYEDVWVMFDSDQEIADTLKEHIDKLEKRIVNQAQKHFTEQYFLLKGIGGLGNVIASTLLYEIYDITRFKSVQKLSSYCRVVDPQCDSSGKRVGRGNKKNGSAWLCWALHMLVSTSCRNIPEVNKLYKQFKKKRGVHHAHRVLAHHWAITIYFMLKNNEPFSLELFFKKFGGSAAFREPSTRTGQAQAA
jgi:transposase